jgi:hypothetical protein
LPSVEPTHTIVGRISVLSSIHKRASHKVVPDLGESLRGNLKSSQHTLGGLALDRADIDSSDEAAPIRSPSCAGILSYMASSAVGEFALYVRQRRSRQFRIVVSRRLFNFSSTRPSPSSISASSSCRTFCGSLRLR